MKLSLHKLAAACSAVLGAGAAHANTLNDFDGTEVIVYAGGATATDNLLENFARVTTGGYCLGNGNIDVYSAANQRIIYCETDSSKITGFPATATEVVFHKESQGGSSNGVIPLIAVANGQGHALRWLDLAALKAASACSTVSLLASDTGQTGLFDVSRRWNCSLTQTAVDTSGSSTYDVHMGVSDTEPALSYPKPTTANANKLAVRPAVHISFGVPVTLNLYRALQENQGLLPADDNSARIPSLTSEQVRGLYSFSLNDWDLIRNSSNQTLTATATTAPTSNGGRPGTAVYLCRRVAASGTQATYESYWLQQRCTGGGPTFPPPDDGGSIDDTIWVTADPDNGQVNAGPSSGDVRNCLNNMNDEGAWAIGTLSNEVTGQQMTNGDFRMVKVDGAPPDLAAHANGDYHFYSESITATIKTGNPGFINVTNPTTNQGRLIRHIQLNLGVPTRLASANTPFAGRPWGNGGSMAIPTTLAVPNTPPASQANMTSNPVNTSQKFGNNCVQPVATRPQPTP